LAVILSLLSTENDLPAMTYVIISQQLAAFSRYSTLHFVPDTIGDLVFNGIPSDVYRRGFANGLQGDGAYKLNDEHTLRAGFTVTGESTLNSNISTVLTHVCFKMKETVN
jgi:hypothetical protein